ncbi:MAG TPA: class I SAM-dependent methyltransferase [Candidatus Baltobacteraceae bacterium]|nr:class I SAM-dependent methyltransferase [Candidatus Baltobacteraceae bacterium]
MDYLSALQLVHTIVAPNNYCEIGCRFGYSLALSKSPAIGIDPDFEIKVAFAAPTRLYRATSDEFFKTQDIRAILGGPVDFAFIDGMHQVEFALRDFMNLERTSHAQGVIAIDDLLPGDLAYATRERKTQIWTGGVYRVIPTLRHYRPDLEIRIYDADMKGFGTVTHLDPSSNVLHEQYETIVADLSQGRWELPSAGAIRASLKQLPTSELAPDLKRFEIAFSVGLPDSSPFRANISRSS